MPASSLNYSPWYWCWPLRNIPSTVATEEADFVLNRPSMQRLAGISRITFTIPTPGNLHFDIDAALCSEHCSHRLSKGFPTQDRSSKLTLVSSGAPWGLWTIFLQCGATKICVTFRNQGSMIINMLDQHPTFVFVTYICICHWHSQNCLLAQASVRLAVVQIVPTDDSQSNSRQIRTLKIGPQMVLVPKNSWVLVEKVGDFLGSCTELMMFLSAWVLLIKIDCTVLQPTLLWK